MPNKINPRQKAGIYFIYCPLSNFYKIGIVRTADRLNKRYRALKGRYGYGQQLELLKTAVGKYKDVSKLEHTLHERYADSKRKRTAKFLHEAEDGTTFTTEAVLNGGTEWFVLSSKDVHFVKESFSSLPATKCAN